jgi:hypothetical protein
MSRKQFRPETQQEGQRLILRNISNFDGGMIRDVDPAEINRNAVYHLENANGFRDSIKGRRGSKLFSATELPKIVEGITARKESNTIIISGNDHIIWVEEPYSATWDTESISETENQPYYEDLKRAFPHVPLEIAVSTPRLENDGFVYVDLTINRSVLTVSPIDPYIQNVQTGSLKIS